MDGKPAASEADALLTEQPRAPGGLRGWSPGAVPGRWACINAACVLASLAVIFAAVVGRVKGSRLGEAPWVFEGYNLYNLATCLLWVLEVGLIVRFSGLGGTRGTRALRGGELALAAYFSCSAVYSAASWWLRGTPPDNEKWILVNSGLNALGYGYELAIDLRAWRRGRAPQAGYAAVPEEQPDATQLASVWEVTRPSAPGPT